MYKEKTFKIKGISPLLLHNGDLANPFNKWTKAMKVITGKRKKTDADHEELSRLEWLGSFYVNEENRPIIPGTNFESMLIQAGKKSKLGESFKAGMICENDSFIEYDGPKTVEEIWNKCGHKFTDIRGVKLNGKTRIMRTRPVFHKWSIEFKVSYLPDILNESQVVEAVTTAGRIIGLGDYKPRFGRFEVVSQ